MNVSSRGSNSSIGRLENPVIISFNRDFRRLGKDGMFENKVANDVYIDNNVDNHNLNRSCVILWLMAEVKDISKSYGFLANNDLSGAWTCCFDTKNSMTSSLSSI